MRNMRSFLSIALKTSHDYESQSQWVLCLTRSQTCGSEPSHDLNPIGASFDPPYSLERRFFPKVGECGVVGDEGAVDSLGLGASSDATDSGGGDGLWRNRLRASLGISSSASRSSTPTREKCESILR
jgi:hypothetical protein